jgi:hypothetical protein
MAYVESHQEIRNHPKTRRLFRALGIHRMQAVGHLHALWWWALDYAPDGDLSRFSADDIADGCDWDGEPETFLQALTSSGWIDDGKLTLHDWDQYGGKYVKRQQQARARQQRYRAQQARSDAAPATLPNAHATPCHADVTRDSDEYARDERVSHDARGTEQTGTESSPAGEDARERATPPPPGSSVRTFVPSAGKTQMPEDWEPSDEDRAFARQHGLSDRQITHQAAKCKSRYRSHGDWREDWSETWRLWVLREIEGGPGAPRLPPLPEADLPPLTEAERAADKAQRDELERQRQEHLANQPSAAERMLQKARDDPDRPDYVAPEQWMIWDSAMRRANSPAMRRRLSK